MVSLPDGFFYFALLASSWVFLLSTGTFSFVVFVSEILYWMVSSCWVLPFSIWIVGYVLEWIVDYFPVGSEACLLLNLILDVYLLRRNAWKWGTFVLFYRLKSFQIWSIGQICNVVSFFFFFFFFWDGVSVILHVGWGGEWNIFHKGVETLLLKWIVRSHIGWGGERSTLYKNVETSPFQMRFKNLEKPGKKSPKITMSTSGGLGLLQMVSELDTGRCASQDIECWRGWTPDSVPARTLGLEGGWIVRSHIDWRGLLQMVSEPDIG